jgi:hypothetical protein
MNGERLVNELGRGVGLTSDAHHQLAATLLGLLAAAAAVVVWRRLAGALVQSLDPIVLLSASGLAATTAATIRIVWLPMRGKRASQFESTGMVIASLAAAAFVAGLLVPGTSIAFMLLAGAIIAAEEIWAWRTYLRRGAARECHEAGWQPALRRRKAGDLPDVVPPKDVVQQLVRSQAADGSEQLRGWLRTRFAAGQRTASAHVAFCPPFAATPQLTVEQIGGPEARLKTGQLLPYGVRIDLKLAEPAEEVTTVLLQLIARSPCS